MNGPTFALHPWACHAIRGKSPARIVRDTPSSPSKSVAPPIDPAAAKKRKSPRGEGLRTAIVGRSFGNRNRTPNVGQRFCGFGWKFESLTALPAGTCRLWAAGADVVRAGASVFAPAAGSPAAFQFSTVQ